MLLPDESGRLARCHLDGQTGLLYRDAADTADHVAGVEQEPELPGRTLGDLVQALRVTGLPPLLGPSRAVSLPGQW